MEPINKRDSLVIGVEGNYYNTKIFEQRIIVLIISVVNNLILNVNKIDNITNINTLFPAIDEIGSFFLWIYLLHSNNPFCYKAEIRSWN